MNKNNYISKYHSILFSITLLLSSHFGHANPLGQIPQIPAFLPSVNQVPATQPMPLDGTWIIDGIGKKVRIESGRAYAVDGWLHLFVLKIVPGMVVIKNITPTGPSQYSGDDLPLLGKWTARVQANRQLAVSVAAMIPIKYTMTPLNLDNQQWFNKEMAKAGLGSPSSGPTPPPVYQLKPPGYSEDGGEDDDYQDEEEGGYQDDEDYNEEEYDEEGSNEEGYDEEDDGDEYGDDEYGDEDEEYDEEDYEEEEAPRKVSAIKHGKAKKGCKGKQIYQSGGSCYSCPDGYRRFSPTRKMTHSKACTERGMGRDTVRAKYKWKTNGCRKGQFKHKGYCKSCPEGTKRKHVAGLDSGYCKVLN